MSGEPGDSTSHRTSGSTSRDTTKKASNPDPFGFDAFDLLPERSSDDTDSGWGGRETRSDAAADLRRFLDEKPPHHL